MKFIQITIGWTLILFAVTGFAGPKVKQLVCHVGNEVGPGGETYLDDPNCLPSDTNNYFCPDAGKIDLILVPENANHLGNDSHSFDGISDYTPDEVDASGEGTEDSDGDGVDDGCQPPEACPCWDEVDLLSVTAENVISDGSCSNGSSYPNLAVIQNDGSTPEVEGGFAAFNDINTFCSTRDEPPFVIFDIAPEEANACIAQIAQRCADIGDPIIPD